MCDPTQCESTVEPESASASGREIERPGPSVMLFPSYFKTLVGKEVTVELKNDLAISGTLHSVDQFLNVKLNNTKVVNEAKYPHMVRSDILPSMHATFITDQVTALLPTSDVCAELLHPRERCAVHSGAVM